LQHALAQSACRGARPDSYQHWWDLTPYSYGDGSVGDVITESSYDVVAKSRQCFGSDFRQGRVPQALNQDGYQAPFAQQPGGTNRLADYLDLRIS
jgi:hypothetical protein